MFSLELDTSEYEAFAKNIAGASEQMPFVLMNILNEAVFKARTTWIDFTWPRNVMIRNQAFMSAALRVDKATKTHLSARLFDSLGRDFLQRLAVGGIDRPRQHRTLAIPLKSWVQRTARGVPRSQSPSAIISNTPDRALRITDKGLFVGLGGRLNLRYSWKDQATQPKLVEFYEDFSYVVNETLRTSFGEQFMRAMKTARY